MVTHHSLDPGSDPAACGRPDAPTHRRVSAWRGLVLAVLGALGLHLLVLGSWPAGAGQAAPVVLPQVLARWLPPPEAAARLTSEPSSSAPGVTEFARSAPAAAAAAPRAGVAPAPAAREAADRQTSSAAPPAGSPAEPAVPAEARGLAVAPATDSAGLTGEPAEPAAAVVELPVYPTRIPPPLRLTFRLERGLLRGDAVLNWQHGAMGDAAPAYQLTLETRAGGLTLLSQSSQGGFDSAGLAPLRFTDRRLRGSTRATSFQRERGVVSFSGPGVEFPLTAGAQDRLSWMVQLAAIVAALPPSRGDPPEIRLQVFGARGDAAVWAFSPFGPEPVATGNGSVAAVKWTRNARAPNDTQVEIWLDPALHHLPVRVRMGNPPDGEVLELLRSAP